MRQYYYYRSIRKTIIQFLDIFRNVQIERLNSSGVLTGYRKVPLKFGLKEKVWYWLHERKDDEMLPIMSVVINSIEYASDRQTSKMRHVIKSKTIPTGEMDKFLNPIPYNIGFTLSIWSLHMVDVDQILEQILPFFTPNIFIRINIPELDANLDVKVIFQSCSPDVSMEMTDEDIRIIKWNIDFIAHTYLFQPLKDDVIIKKVIQKIYTESSSWNHRFTESEFTSGASPDDYESMSVYTKAISPYFDEPDWEPSTEYSIGDIVKPTVTNGYIYEACSITIPCESGIVEPTWPTTDGTPVIDNDIVWEKYEKEDYKKLAQIEHFSV